jgi:hypothetical protein
LDKFNRRPTKKAQAQKAVFFVICFSLAAGGFAALIAFGNASIPWFLGIYAVFWVLAFLAWSKGLIRNYHLWRSGLILQDNQGPGFSTLEVAAINELLVKSGPEAMALRRHFEGAEVVARYNSGLGGVTTFQSEYPRSVTEDVTNHISWFSVNDLGVVGTKFWADQTGLIVMLEFFTGGRNTAHFDWTKVLFVAASEDLPRPRIPSMAPVITEPHWVRWQPEI